MPRPLPTRPDKGFLRKLAKRRHQVLLKGDHKARLCDAQREIAKQYGYGSWRTLLRIANAIRIERAKFESAVKDGRLGSCADLLSRGWAAFLDFSAEAKPDEIRAVLEHGGRVDVPDWNHDTILH